MKDNDSMDQKEVAFYAAAVQAWIATRMEKDRILLTLSAAGIGLLVTLLTAVGPSSTGSLVLYVLAASAFLSAICCGVWIFSRNAAHLEDVVVHGSRDHDLTLVRLDTALALLFIVGVVLAGAVAVQSGLTRMPSVEEKKVGERKGRETAVGQPAEAMKSVTGVGNLRPAKPPAKPGGDQGGSQGGAPDEGSGSSGSEGGGSGGE